MHLHPLSLHHARPISPAPRQRSRRHGPKRLAGQSHVALNASHRSSRRRGPQYAGRMTLAADLRPGYKDRRSAAGIGRGGSGMATKKRTVAKGLARGLTNYGDNAFSLYMRRRSEEHTSELQSLMRIP